MSTSVLLEIVNIALTGSAVEYTFPKNMEAFIASGQAGTDITIALTNAGSDPVFTLQNGGPLDIIDREWAGKTVYITGGAGDHLELLIRLYPFGGAT